MPERPRLDSWKEIARHLGRDVRTVIRWEQQRGLPVHRVPGGRLPRVFAYTRELDAWLAQRSVGLRGDEEPIATETGGRSAPPSDAERKTRWQRLVLVGTAGALVILVGATAWTLRGDAPLQRLAVVGSEVHALDGSGRTLWIHGFDSKELKSSSTRWSHVGDLDSDGRNEALAAVEVRVPPSTGYAGELLSFAADGRLRWSVAVDDRVTFRDGEYGPPWSPADMVVYRAGAEPRIAWAVHHFTWWPSLLITLNGRGERVGTFVNSGWIRGATPSRDGRHLIITGVTNSRRSYFVAVLDAERPSGRSPEPPGSPMECVSCPSGGPLQYLVLPRTDVSYVQPFPGEGPSVMTFEDGTVQVHALESTGSTFAATIYELSPDLTIREARFGDAFWEWHRLLEAEGKLQHRAEDCPERRGLEVQRWTPATGWQSLQVPVR